MTLFTFLKLLGCLALLMFGLKMFSEALQKLTGGGLRKVLTDSDNQVDPHESLNIEHRVNNYRTQLKENNVVEDHTQVKLTT